MASAEAAAEAGRAAAKAKAAGEEAGTDGDGESDGEEASDNPFRGNSSTSSGPSSGRSKGKMGARNARRERRRERRRQEGAAVMPELQVVAGKLMAAQAALSLACLYGGRLAAGSLFAAYYVHLPAFVLDLGTAAQLEDSRDTAVLANVLLWATALIGALIASNLVGRWAASRKRHASELALTKVTPLLTLNPTSPSTLTPLPPQP